LTIYLQVGKTEPIPDRATTGGTLNDEAGLQGGAEARSSGGSFSILDAEALERTGGWSLVRRSLGIRSFGANLVEIAPGTSIPEHDEIDRDQEELFYFISGDSVLVIDGVDHGAPAGTFARLDTAPRRTVRNDGSQPAQVLIVSAPRSSGYVPMEWA
jgi:hypothetical protein